MTTPVFLGIDVNKAQLDLGSSAKHLRGFANTPVGIEKLIVYCERLHEKQAIALVCVESTGVYSYAVVVALHAAGFPVSLVQPSRVRCFAASAGVLAKTDAIDAAIIARFGEKMEPRLYAPPTAHSVKLRALVDRRTQVIDDRVREHNRLEACLDASMAKRITKHIRQLKKEEAALEKEMAAVIESDDGLAAKSQAMQTVNGIAMLTTAVLLSYLPELGQMNRQHITALAGLAPYDQSSGTKIGRKHVKGGRERVREGLYMSALSAIQHNAVLKEKYQRMVKRGKLKKVAQVACMRTLVVHLNTLLANLGNAPAQPA